MDLRPLGRNRCGTQFIKTFQDAFDRIGRDGRHGIFFVVQRDVVHHVLVSVVHTANTVLDDDGQLIGIGRIVTAKVGTVEASKRAVAVFVLKSFAVERGPTRRPAEQEPSCAHIRRGPDQIADPLEAEHGVIDVKRNRGHAVRRVSGARGDEGAHRCRLR